MAFRYKIVVGVILSCTFIFSFLLATDLFDTFAKAQGFYTEGVKAENELKAEWN